MKQKWLGLDLGAVRIGVALSEEFTGIALPHRTLANDANAIAEIRSIAQRERVAGIVLGFPIKLDGSRGIAAEKTEEFKRQLTEAIPDLRIVLWDERLTTAEAQKILRTAGKDAKQSRKVIDQVAAQILLQSYLDSTLPPL
jgi:putative Holliday junction resolvase